MAKKIKENNNQTIKQEIESIDKTEKGISNEKTKKRKKKNQKRKIPKVLKIVIALIVAVVLMIIGIKFSETMTKEETVINFGFKDVGVLVTQEWYGRILQDSVKDRKLFKKFSIPFTESRIIFSLDVEVLAGMNFEEIEYKIKKDNTVEIKLPKTEVYKYYQVPNTYKNYLDDESWFTNIDSTERHNLEDAVVEIGKEEALKAGLLDKATKNAKKIIEQMVKSQNKNYKIEWK